ncbi:MAG: hypothetical protein V5A39_02715 [Haloarculaceae archaeon]
MRRYRRRTVYAVGVPYTLAQLGLWYYLNFAAGPKAFPADVGTLGAADKVILTAIRPCAISTPRGVDSAHEGIAVSITQVVLVVVLVVLLR